MMETFRSKDTISAIYFDGSFETAVEVAKIFLGVSIQFSGNETFLLRVYDQAAYIGPHSWVYKNENGRLEWRDTEELSKKWDKWSETKMPELKPLPVKPARKKARR